MNKTQVSESKVNNIIYSFLDFYEKYANTLIDCNDTISQDRIERFKEWHSDVAPGVFNSIFHFISKDASEEKIISLCEMLKMLLIKSQENHDYESLIDNLYYIPAKMKSSFEKFGLIETIKTYQCSITLQKQRAFESKLILEKISNLEVGDSFLGSPVFLGGV